MQFVILIVLAMQVLFVRAGPSLLSTLACASDDIIPSTPINCTISVLDEEGNPTPAANPTVFQVVVNTSTPWAITASTLSSDKLSISFTVTPSAPGPLSIRVVQPSSGTDIQSSPLSIFVYAYPLLRIDALMCANPTLDLRATTNCSARAYGDNNIPAYVKPGDVVVTGGTATVIPMSRRLMLMYTAPSSMTNTLSGKVTLFVTILGSPTKYNYTITLRYPRLPPSEASILTCSTARRCVVAAFDDLGPVFMNPDSFNVIFSSATVPDSTLSSELSYTWSPGADDSQRTLTYTVLNSVTVFNATMVVYLRSTAAPITNSPAYLTVGVIPTPDKATFVSCASMQFIAPSSTTSCSISVSPDQTPDPTFFVMTASAGTISGVTTTSTAAGSFIMFNYTSPATISYEAKIQLHATINGVDIKNSPIYLFLYASNAATVVGTTNYTTITIFGSFVFASMLLATCIVVAVKRRRQYDIRRTLKESRSMTPRSAALDATMHVSTHH